MLAVMQGKVDMRDVKVSVDELLSKVKANREKHIAEYEEAVEGYREAYQLELTKAAFEINRRILDQGEPDLESIKFLLAVPQNHASDYDQVITMLEMSVDIEATIKADEFACFVMDNWKWKADFLHVSGFYKGCNK